MRVSCQLAESITHNAPTKRKSELRQAYTMELPMNCCTERTSSMQREINWPVWEWSWNENERFWMWSYRRLRRS